MASPLSVITAAVLLLSFIKGVRAQQQNDSLPANPSEAIFGTVQENVGQFGRSLNCDALKAAVQRAIDAHADWRQWLYEFRHNQSEFIEQCESGEQGDVQAFMEEQKQLLTCPEAYNHTWTVALVFIILFLLALVGLIGMTVLYYRK